MASDHKTGIDQNSERVIRWLLEHRTEFESNGIEEQLLTTAIGLSEDEVRGVIDHLESHEDVARIPEALSNPPRFLLKPARGWSEIVEKGIKEKSARGKA